MRYLNGLFFSAFLIFPLAARAHPGDHSSIATVTGAGTHFVAQPDHALLLLMAICGILYVYRLYARAIR